MIVFILESEGSGMIEEAKAMIEAGEPWIETSQLDYLTSELLDKGYRVLVKLSKNEVIKLVSEL